MLDASLMTGSAPLLVEDDGVRLRDRRAAALVEALGARSLVLVGMMGCGKSSTGRCLARRLGLDFADADAEIECAAGMSVAEIFEKYGEAYFRDGERRVMARLLAGGPKVIATGGGAFLNEQTRARISASGLSVWLKADLDVLWRRVRRRATRPLLRTEDPEGTLRALIEARYPVYGRADVTVVFARRAARGDGRYRHRRDRVLPALFSRGPDPDHAARRHHARETPAVLGPPGATRVRSTCRAANTRSSSAPACCARRARWWPSWRRARLARLSPTTTSRATTSRHSESSLDRAGIRHATATVRPRRGDRNPTLCSRRVCDAILAARLERGDLVLAFGGGVVGDLAGFAAASVRRGMRLVQIPTSLLAQVDSSVGGKTGINSAHGKNLVGAFHQPALVIADADVLATLPPREFAAGYAEIVKWALIGDAAFFDWLEANHAGVFTGGPARAEAVAKACAGKAGVVMRDEREHGERALLNLGHTFGHAFERLAGYDGARLVHGEGVAIGLACAFRFSHRLGLCAAADAARVEAHLAAVGLPTHASAIPGLAADAEAVLDAMAQDKKVERGALTFILARGIGQAFVAKGIAADEVRAFLEQDLQAKA